MDTWADRLFRFYASLRPTAALPQSIGWLHPQQSPEVLDVLRRFLQKFFNDSHQRTLLLGINPGRFGAGITGVNFTAAKQLREDCGIEHPFKDGSELSAEFVYRVINAYGGPQAFYRRFFIGSVCPLGFVKDGKNLNYYDDKELQKAVEPFIVQSIEAQLSFPVDRGRCLCIGGEKNFKALQALNHKHRWFQTVVPLPHPRFVMQYRRRQVPQFVQLYLEAFEPKA